MGEEVEILRNGQPDTVSHSDPHRPEYHFLPPANWLNDPNGLIEWRGQYHLFYQYNPYKPVHDRIHWGHAVSNDLVYWQGLPEALEPTPGGPDADGCWSGCAVNDNGIPRIFYTGVFPQVVCTAISTDGLHTWEKYEHNPVIPGPPAEISTEPSPDFRDPYVWQDGDKWYMVIGTKYQDIGGAILLYSSDDLGHWTYEGPLLVGDKNKTTPLRSGAMWECPNFLQVGDHHVLIFSVAEEMESECADSVYFPEHLIYPVFYIGTFEHLKFSPITQGLVDYGGCFYAPLVMRDSTGRFLMWGWLREGRSAHAQLEAGWSGVMSLPRVISLGPDGLLRFAPVPELQTLRRQQRHYGNLLVSQGSVKDIIDVSSTTLEMLVEIEVGESSTIELILGYLSNRGEITRISYSTFTDLLEVDTTQSSDNPDARGTLCQAPLVLDEGEVLRLHLFVDRSVLEVFANDRICMSSRMYPTSEGNIGIRVVGARGRSRIRSIDMWEVDSIYTR